MGQLCDHPPYQPLLFPEIYEGKPVVLVVWAPGGDTRPYEAPSRGGGRAYYVRSGSETVEATGAFRNQLFEQAARVPFDDRRSLAADMDAVSERLVGQFLKEVGSALAEDVRIDPQSVYSRMRLDVPLNDHRAPRNFALLFFNNYPEEIFPGAQIDVVQFLDDVDGNLIHENIIVGPIHHQIRDTLRYLESLQEVLIEKAQRGAEAKRTVKYPLDAVREAVVNAVYHRAYQSYEPTKVYIYPDRMTITSYPGPVHGIEPHHFANGGAIPSVPARNRKIGELLKELRLAESRGTGLPRIRHSMAANGSPSPRFDFDVGRTSFTVTLPAHPRFG